jgi:hypothetical protein
MSQTTNEPGFDTGTPPTQPRKAWHAHTGVRVTGAIAALIVAGSFGAAAASGTAHPAAKPATPPTTSAPSTGNHPSPATPGWGDAPVPGVTPSADPTPAGPDQLQAGDTETLGNNSDNTVGTVTVGKPVVTTWPAQSYGEKPANGYYVIIKVTAKADPSYTDGWFVSPLDFHAVVRGQHYDEDNGHAYDGMTDAQESTDLSTTLGAGETVTGYIAFDVPSAHGKIVYAPNSDGQPIAEWSY